MKRWLAIQFFIFVSSGFVIAYWYYLKTNLALNTALKLTQKGTSNSIIVTNLAVSEKPVTIPNFRQHLKKKYAEVAKIKNNLNEITDFEKCAGDISPNWKQFNGVWINLHPTSMDIHISGRLSKGEDWENDKFKFLSEHITSSKIFVDVGANIGVFTLQALHKGYNVIAVEAFSAHIQRLCSSIIRNNFANIKLYHNAVWDNNEGTLGFQSPPDNIGGTKVIASSSGKQVSKILIGDIVTHLDEYVMKIDIEAAECRALRSAEFWNNPPVALCMEWGDLKRNTNLCPKFMYSELVENVTHVYGQNLRYWKGWDAPNLLIQRRRRFNVH